MTHAQNATNHKVVRHTTWNVQFSFEYDNTLLSCYI